MDLFETIRPLHVALVAGLFQVIGYVVYQSIARIEPQPTSWFMWGSTTWVIAVLEADSMIGEYGRWEFVPIDTRGLLVLPIICGCMSAVIAIQCWRRGKLIWPEVRPDQISLILGISLTGAYIATWGMVEYEIIANRVREIAAFSILVLLNLVTIIEFAPLIRNTRLYPDDEAVIPWLIWACAYTSLFIATWWEYGLSELLIYPSLNVLLHGYVAWLARPYRTARISNSSQ